MAHKHSVYDSDPHFTIDAASRVITNTSDKVAIMQYDHNSERFTFEIPRMVDEHDMSLCNRVRVHYINIDAATKESNADVYEVEDLQISPASDDVVICSWLISQNATRLVGPLTFRIEFACLADDGKTIDYAWHTAIHKGIVIADGIYTSEIVVEQYTDLIERWKDSVMKEFGAEIDQIEEDMKADVTEWKQLETANVRGYVTPEMFGATGDGITDDTKAITDAVKFSDEKGIELRLVAPYNIVLAEPISVTNSLIIRGMENGKLIVNGAFLLSTGNVLMDSVFMECTNIQGQLLNQGDSADSSLTLQNCTFYFSGMNFGYFLYAENANITLNDCRFKNCGVTVCSESAVFNAKSCLWDMSNANPGLSQEPIHLIACATADIGSNTFVNCVNDAVDCYPGAKCVNIHHNRFCAFENKAIEVKTVLRDIGAEEGSSNEWDLYSGCVTISHNFFDNIKAVNLINVGLVGYEYTGEEDLTKYLVHNVVISDNIFRYDSDFNAGQSFVSIVYAGHAYGLTVDNNLVIPNSLQGLAIVSATSNVDTNAELPGLSVSHNTVKSIDSSVTVCLLIYGMKVNADICGNVVVGSCKLMTARMATSTSQIQDNIDDSVLRISKNESANYDTSYLRGREIDICNQVVSGVALRGAIGKLMLSNVELARSVDIVGVNVEKLICDNAVISGEGFKNTAATNCTISTAIVSRCKASAPDNVFVSRNAVMTIGGLLTYSNVSAIPTKYSTKVEIGTCSEGISGQIEQWLPENGMTQEDLPSGFFAYSTRPDLLPGIGYPGEPFNGYGTFFGINATNYGVYLYLDVFGNLAAYNTNQNRWTSMMTADGNTTYSLAMDTENIVGAVKLSLNGSDGSASTVNVPRGMRILLSDYVGGAVYTHAASGQLPNFYILHLNYSGVVQTATVLTRAVIDAGSVTYPFTMYMPVEGTTVTVNLVVESTSSGLTFTAQAGTISYIAGYA